MSDPLPFGDGTVPGGPFDPGAFGFVYFDDIIVQATLLEVDGCTKPEEWQITKGSGSDGATADWKGTKLAEKIKLKFRATTDAEYADQGRLRDQLRPKLGQKPPSVTITLAMVNWGGIYKVRLVEPAYPKWVADKRAFDFEWEVGEHAPSKQTKTGASDPAKPESADAGGKQSAAEKELANLLKEAKSL